MFTTLNLPSTTTNALFISQAQNKSSFKAGTWFDKSLLSFTEVGGDGNGIYAYIQNVGSENMAVASKYYVYYSANGNPVSPQGETGELVFATGVIPKMVSKGSAVKLTYSSTKPLKSGFYMFVAFQNHEAVKNGSELLIEGRPVTVSQKINVNNK
ncbi:hypothetical protein PH210_11455 [Paenibacillus sp. BSR1-1]|uniref:hypothetical protein n=1 Tax=Paenibacillus sp. BSR1-1 TaxID=3020845 RepID=UPI0025B027D9|nr:hypothetical protein [Paenibacillus sp. BSR1-1]MDN3016812.1 hypothetical protein [Paenibacillus sp. BSR1-1]